MIVELLIAVVSAGLGALITWALTHGDSKKLTEAQQEIIRIERERSDWERRYRQQQEPLKRARVLAEEIRGLNGKLSLEEHEVIIRDALQSSLIENLQGIEPSVKDGLKESKSMATLSELLEVVRAFKREQAERAARGEDRPGPQIEEKEAAR